VSIRTQISEYRETLADHFNDPLAGQTDDWCLYQTTKLGTVLQNCTSQGFISDFNVVTLPLLKYILPLSSLLP